MELIKTRIEGLVILRPRVFGDSRGYFFESFSEREFERLVGPVGFVQDNESLSQRGVLRGLHFQRPPHAQAKLIRCVVGEVVDVAVDIRPGSPTFGQHVAVTLSAENHLQLFIPEGFAHGFAVCSDSAICQYKCTDFYAPETEGGIDPLDPELGIDWGIDLTRAILSPKDRRHPTLRALTQ